MNKHGLNFISTEDMSREAWLKKRMDGIGGSDISSILGLNERFSAVELFYQKVGFSPNTTEENPAMFWGTRLEDNVLNIAQYYDFDTGEYIDNFNSQKKLRKITKLRYMVQNPAHPHLLANLDGAVDFVARKFTMDGPAEAKTISRQTAEKYQNGIPPYHITQITTYCIACEPMMTGNSACIFYLKDGREFYGFNVPVIESIRDMILTKSEAFWQKILKGREILANVSDNDLRLKYLAEIEPSPDNTQAYYQFTSELHEKKSQFVRISATDEDISNALLYQLHSQNIKELEEARQVNKNHIMKSLRDSGANVIDFPNKAGRITYNKKLYININEEKLKA